MTLRIRTGNEGDIEAVLALWSRSGAEPTHTDDIGGVRTMLERDPGALLVAEEDGRLVGSVVAGWDGWRGSVYRLVVDRSGRRRGIATRLLRAAERRLEDLGAVRLQAIVVESDEALAFWSVTGWERQVDRVRFVRG